MRHVVDKVVLHLRQLLLAESQYYRVDKDKQQYERQHKRRYHELYRRENVVTLRGEHHFQVVYPVHGVAGENHLRIHIAAIGIWRISCRVIHHIATSTHHSKLKRKVKSIVLKLRAQICAHECRVGSLLYRAIARFAQYIQYHLIEQPFLVKILSFEYFLHAFVVVAEVGVAVSLFSFHLYRAPVALYLQARVTIGRRD